MRKQRHNKGMVVMDERANQCVYSDLKPHTWIPFVLPMCYNSCQEDCRAILGPGMR